MPSPEDESFDKILRRVARTPDVPDRRRRVRPGTLLAGRFDVERKLGEGGMGQVFAALDHERDERVALKVVGQLTARSIAQLKREFRVASELVHPNLVRLHELFVDGLEWFFTMDLVDGLALPRILERERGARADVLRSVFRQLASGLAALHEAGTIHGDLKPSNFLVTRNDHRVVLLDFGLARPIGLAPEVGGTLAYMAPEQALGQSTTDAADWYSFGVVLHEAITGELPRGGLAARQAEPGLEDFVQLCERLLRIAPEERPAGRDILQALGAATETWSRFSSLPPSSTSSLIGRRQEIQALDEALTASVHGATEVVLVSGQSGVGKTALIERFLEIARKRSATVLRGRCRDRESIGYKAGDGVIDDLIHQLERMEDAEVASLLPKDIADLVVLFPALRTVGAIADAPRARADAADQGLQRQRAIGAFVELFGNLRARGPLVVWIDDLQWSDGESAVLLGPLLGGVSPAPILFVGSHRGEPQGAVPLLEALGGDRSLSLPRPRELAIGELEEDDAERLALALLGADVPDPEVSARRIAREAGGHPLFIAELSHTIRAAGGHGATAATLSDLISRRTASLPERARSLLELVAIAARPLPRRVFGQAVRLRPADAEAAFELLRATRFVHGQGVRDEHLVDVRHDRIREIVVQGLDEGARRLTHLTLARALEGRPEFTPDLLATHYEAGGDVERAGRYWLAAGDAASTALAFSQAAALYDRALRLAVLEAGERRTVEIRRGDALAHAGNGADAARVYLSAAAQSARDEAIELRRRAAEQLFLSGYVERGLDVIDQVLAATGMGKTRSGRSALLSVAFGRMRVRARGLRPVSRRENELSREELARLDASWTIACSLGFIDFLRAADFQNKHLLLALKAGEPHRLLRALTLEAVHVAASGAGAARRTETLLLLADDLARQSANDADVSLVLLCHGVSAYLQGHVDVALAKCEEALGLLTTRCRGAVWERLNAQRFVVASLFFSGRLRRMTEFMKPLLAEADSTGNLYASNCFRSAYGVVPSLAADRPGEARAQLSRAREEWEAPGYQLPHANLLIGETLVDLYCGEFEVAHGRLVAEWPTIARAQLLRIGILRTQLLHLRALAAAGAASRAEGDGRTASASALQADLRWCGAALARDPMQRAPALAALIGAAIDGADGNRLAAREKLQASIDAFSAQGMRLFAEAARARIGPLHGGVRGAQLAESAEEAFRREGVVDPSRMTALIAPHFG